MVNDDEVAMAVICFILLDSLGRLANVRTLLNHLFMAVCACNVSKMFYTINKKKFAMLAEKIQD